MTAKINEPMKMRGDVHLKLFDEFGNLKDERFFKNLIVTAGKEWAASQIDDDNNDPKMSHMALGTGTTSPVVGNTTLETESARVALSDTTRDAAITTYSASFGAGTGTGAVTEAGIFNDASAGTMLSRVTFAAVNKLANDTLAIDWSITMT